MEPRSNVQMIQFVLISDCGRMTVHRCVLSVVLCIVYATTCGSYYNTWSDNHREPKDIMVDVVNRLGLLVLKVHNFNNENNIALSPYGVTSILTALLEGVRGSASQELQQCAGFPSNPDIIRIGLRDIHRQLRSYFIPKEGFLSGLSLSSEKVTLNPEYQKTLRFYGFDMTSFNTPVYPEVTTTPVNNLTTTETLTTTDQKATTNKIEKIETTTEDTTKIEVSTIVSTTEATSPLSRISSTPFPLSSTSGSVATVAEDTTKSTTTAATTTITTTTTTTSSSTTTPSVTTTTPSTTTTSPTTTTTSPTTTTSRTTSTTTASPPTTILTTAETKTVATTAETTTEKVSVQNRAGTDDIETTEVISTTELTTETPSTTETTTEELTTTEKVMTTTSETETTIEVTTVEKEEDVSTTETVTAEITTLPEEQKERKKRSIVDYFIARYYDDNHDITSFHLPHFPRYEQPRKEINYSFLVNGQFEETGINFMTYDVVLPFYYIHNLNALALKFPLDSPKYYLLLVLPIDSFGINKLICDIDQTITLKEIVSHMRPTYVRAVIPSFMLRGFVILTSTLQKIGIRQIFEPRHSDFSPMTSDKNIYVTNIEQAITVMIKNYMDPKNMSMKNGHNYQYGPVEFRATHPFLYFVMDTEFDIALVAGKIVNPLNSRIQ